LHEAAITAALVEQVRSFVPAGATLDAVRVEVGELEHLDSEVMRTLWQAMIEDTDLAGAELEIDRVALSVRCGACGEVWNPEDPAILLCPKCGVVRPEVLEGSGILLRSLSVEEPEDG
jgi:hydrogenase nickel incorporation protein HypA/HybF